MVLHAIPSFYETPVWACPTRMEQQGCTSKLGTLKGPDAVSVYGLPGVVGQLDGECVSVPREVLARLCNTGIHNAWMCGNTPPYAEQMQRQRTHFFQERKLS